MIIIGWRKDAEAAGKFIRVNLIPKKKITPLDDATFYWLGRWAGHWGRKELSRLAGLDS